jgi:hypothetical protein
MWWVATTAKPNNPNPNPNPVPNPNAAPNTNTNTNPTHLLQQHASTHCKPELGPCFKDERKVGDSNQLQAYAVESILTFWKERGEACVRTELTKLNRGKRGGRERGGGAYSERSDNFYWLSGAAAELGCVCTYVRVCEEEEEEEGGGRGLWFDSYPWVHGSILSLG